MPEQHRELLDRLYESFNRRDMPGMLDCFDRDIEVSAPEGLEYASLMVHLLGGRFVVLLDSYRGHEEVRRLYDAVWAISDFFLVEAMEFLEHDDSVVVPVVIRARSAQGGSAKEARAAHLWTIGKGKITRLRIYVDRTRAMAAIGLPDESPEE